MKKAKKLALLENAVTQNGFKLRYEKGNFLGGDCRLRNDNIIVVNKFLPIEGKIFTIASVLHKLNPADCPPEVKKIIEDSGLNSGNQLPLIESE